MTEQMSKAAIVKNLSLVADWLRAKYPGRCYELEVAGGAALAFLGCKSATIDVDVLRPRALPAEVQEAARIVARAQGLGSAWLSTGVANVVALVETNSTLPAYFADTTVILEVAPNLILRIVGRQTLISLKLLAASPTERKHIADLKSLAATSDELKVAREFVLAFDSSTPRQEDLALVLVELEASHAG